MGYNTFEGLKHGDIITPANSGGISGNPVAILPQPTTGNRWIADTAAAVHGLMGASRVVDANNNYQRYDEEATSGRGGIERWVTVPAAPIGIPANPATVLAIYNTAGTLMAALGLRSDMRWMAMHGGFAQLGGDTQMSPAITPGRYRVQCIPTQDRGTAGRGRIECGIWREDGSTVFTWDSGVGALTINTGSLNPFTYRIGGVTSATVPWLTDRTDSVQFGDRATGWFPPLPSNTAPIANAGPDITVAAGRPFTLTGTDVDADSNVTTRQWLLDGTVVGTGPTYIGVAPITLAGTTLTFTYRATDATGAIGSDPVTVTVRPAPRRIMTAAGIRPSAIRRVTTS